MFISLHKESRVGDHWRFSSGWETREVGSARDIARAVLKFSNSPIEWANGERKRENFVGASWAVLDVDSGCTIKEAVDIYGSYQHFVGTTKSHQKTKGTQQPRDRFRLWIRLEGVCRSPEDYRETLRQLGSRVGADEQAYDAARKYLPCASIVCGNVEGKLANISKFIAPVVEKMETIPSRQGFIPKFIKEWMTTGVAEGSRNASIFKTGYYLSRNGFSKEEILSITMHSNLSLGISNQEITQTLVRGFNAGRRN
jgi:hypothetical protein